MRMPVRWDKRAKFVSLLRHPSPRPRRTLRLPAGPADQDALPILNIVAPHSPHMPRVAALPFFIVTGWPFWISRLSRHLMQYPVIGIVPSFLTSQMHAAGIHVRRPRDRIIAPGALHGLAYLVARIHRHRTFRPICSSGDCAPTVEG